MSLYALTIFTSAFLLFLVQPIIAKQILPWFGGSAAVWTTCLVFFQSVLLAGYAYADWTTRLGARRQAMLHGALLALSLACLPILASSGWKPHGDEEPITRILLLLDGLSAFRDAYESEVGRAAVFGAFQRVVAEGRPLGVHVAMSAERPGALPTSLAGSVQRRLVLRQADENAYGVLDVPKDVLQQTMEWHWPSDVAVADSLPGYRPTVKGHPRMVREAARLILPPSDRCCTSVAASSRHGPPRRSVNWPS